MFAWILQWVRALGHKFFLRFGLHCATHQIRIILVSGIVITSLLYPALDLYIASNTHIFNPFSSIQAHRDLRHLWEPHETLVAREDPVSRARCGTGATVRVERVLVQSPLSDDNDDGSLNQRILKSTLHFERRLQEQIMKNKIPCLTRIDGNCFVVSPLAFWNHDERRLHSDTSILDTLSATKDVSVDGIPVTPHMVLAGRVSTEPHTFDYAEFLALTYFITENDCFGPSDRFGWLKAVKSAAGQDAELVPHSEDPRLIALEYDPNRSGKNGWSAISALPYFAYTGFVVYVFWSMRQLASVHSRAGLAFTAIVEIIVSTITSLSVCALVGFKVTLVPWELLPIVIVFVGAENMFHLVDAVVKTPVTLSVKQRVAEGLSRAGTSNTLKVVSYNTILGVIAVFSSGAIRQFCIFAIVVLVAHWFLAHTFFMAVLSIDIQRLELDELLQQDAGLTPSLSHSAAENPTSKSQSTVWKLGRVIRKLWNGRAKKNLSLVLLLAITATLYYATMPPEITPSDMNVQSNPRGALSRSNASLQISQLSNLPDRQIWKLLNPTGAPFHLRVESPSILTLGSDASEQSSHPHSHGKRNIRQCRPVVWWIKIMVLPMATTIFLLWVLLLYLLKDAELLDTQRHRVSEPSKNMKLQMPGLEQKTSFSTLPRAFPSDVELIATSADGRVVISIGLHNEVAIWRAGSDDEQFYIDASNALSQASTSLAKSTLTAVAMESRGEYCAVGSGSGVIAVYNIRKKNDFRTYPHLTLPDSSAGVADLKFVSPSSAFASSSTVVYLIATYENNAVVKYTLGEGMGPGPLYLRPSSSSIPILYTKLLPTDGGVLVAFCLENGVAEVVEVGFRDLPLMKDNLLIQAGHPMDVVNNLHLCQAVIDGETRVVIAVATENGVLSVWDGQTGECIRVLDITFGRVDQLRVSPLQTETCHFCGDMPPDGVCLSFSVDQVVRLYKVYRNTEEVRRCSCTLATTSSPSKKKGSLGRRSRSGSVTSASASPLRPSIPMRNRVASLTDISPFPISGHGGHSRRGSEKDSRRGSEGMISILALDFEDTLHGKGPPVAVPSFWQRSYVVFIAETECERGGWDIRDGKVVGVRRRPRTSAPGSTSTDGSSVQGLPSSVLGRWEIWTLDPCIAHIQSSAISALATESPSPSSSAKKIPPTARPRIPHLPFTRVSPFIVTRSSCMTGFGNTLGVFKFLNSR